MTRTPRVKTAVPKPHIRMRKLSSVGRSAFPPAPSTAFDPGSSGAGPAQAFPTPIAGAAAPGDIGG